MKYDTEKRVFMVKNYIKTPTVSQVQSAYRVKYKVKRAPSRSAILHNKAKLEKNGAVVHIPIKKPKISQKRLNAKNVLKLLIEENAALSIRKLSSAAEISFGMTQSILRRDLKLKPYKYQEAHHLEPADYQKRVTFAEWINSLPQEDLKFMNFSDEAYFYLTESVNKQNNRMWLNERPIDWIERPLQDAKVLVWCAISAKKIYGPYFFETTVNQHTYVDMLKTFFWPKHLRTAEYKKYYFQQDGATAHTATMVQDWLKSKIGDKFMDKQKWPPRSPDLNPCDYFLWGYLKSRVYSPLPKTLDELKANIEQEIKKIKPEILEKVFVNLRKRCNFVIENFGGHFEKK